MADLASQLLSPRKLQQRRSNVSLRGSSSLTQDLGGDGNRFTLAHELAAAMMPDTGSSSRSLAEEFGIEFDGEDEEEQEPEPSDDPTNETLSSDLPIEQHPSHHSPPKQAASRSRGSSVTTEYNSNQPRKQAPPAVFEQDPLTLLSQNLKSTDLFLNQLRRLDTESTLLSASHEPPLEQLAADIIRRINETTRAREEQVRELSGYEREFRKIAGELGGNDLLGELDALMQVEGLIDHPDQSRDTGDDDNVTIRQPSRPVSGAWEDAPDPHSLDVLEEEEGEYSFYDQPSPTKEHFLPPAPPQSGPATPVSTLPHLAHMRSITQSLASTLGTISEQAQVNGAATAEAGRKIKALKNRLGGWRSEWESAEKSRIRVEKWESGIWDEATEPSLLTSSTSSREDSPTPGTPTATAPGKRLDARKIVEEELRAFSQVLIEAGNKTKAIMASS